MKEKILAHFAEQAMYCDMFGSPFTAQLIKSMSEDYQGGGPIAALLKDWDTNPRADALALRLAGYFHHAVLVNRDAALAAHYPSSLANWSIEDIWPLARTLLEREPNAAAAFIRSAPQTNETRRSIALLAAFLTFADTWKGEVDMLEIGASAGLNLLYKLRGNFFVTSYIKAKFLRHILNVSALQPPLTALNIKKYKIFFIHVSNYFGKQRRMGIVIQ